jgi:hypothetical protein
VLGAFAKATKLVKLESLAEVVMNKQALQKGFDTAVVKVLA